MWEGTILGLADCTCLLFVSLVLHPSIIIFVFIAIQVATNLVDYAIHRDGNWELADCICLLSFSLVNTQASLSSSSDMWNLFIATQTAADLVDYAIHRIEQLDPSSVHSVGNFVVAEGQVYCRSTSNNGRQQEVGHEAPAGAQQ